MNNVMIGQRAVRTNWASRRAVNTINNGASEDEKLSMVNSKKINEHFILEKIMNSTDKDNTTVYIGNLNATTTSNTTLTFTKEQSSNSNSLEDEKINKLVNGILDFE